MKLAKVPLLGVFALGLILTVLSGNSVVRAQDGTLTADHYKIYDLSGDPIISGQVELLDQFGLSLNDFSGPVHFGLPTDKNGEGILDPRLHYTWYKIGNPEPGRSIVYDNQFGTNVLNTFESNYMLVPALKFPEGDQTLPTANHYKCYRADGPPLGRDVVLETQFGLENVILDRPEIFCNPAQKFVPSTGEVFPIVDEVNHLVCYRIEPPSPIGVSVSYVDQFGPGGGVLGEGRWLCVPSKKTGVTQASDGSWGELKAIYR